MTALKPIKLWSHKIGPNPWKVVFVFEELGLPYETEFLDLTQVKEPAFISINPNGRVPAIEDPNTGFTIWESGAIMEYLIDEYDKDHKLSYDTKPEKYLTRQWLYFQMSGQGPYFGQLGWFSIYHHERLPSAIERYEKELHRVVSVLDLHLSRTGQKYLVGDKCTYADLSFIPWVDTIERLNIDVHPNGINQHYKEWLDRIRSREAIKPIMAERARLKQEAWGNAAPEETK